MDDKIKSLKAQISEKEGIMKEVAKAGNEDRAFQLFKEAQKLRTELSLMTKFKKQVTIG